MSGFVNCAVLVRCCAAVYFVVCLLCACYMYARMQDDGRPHSILLALCVVVIVSGGYGLCMMLLYV